MVPWPVAIPVAAVAVLALALVPATGANAEDVDVDTPGWKWLSVRDTTLGIGDATAYHRDVLGTGDDLLGWTSDAFDQYESINGFLDGVGYDHVLPNLDAWLFPEPVSSSVTPDGASFTSRVEETHLGDDDFLDVEFTLEIVGSFARWTIELVGATHVLEGVYGSGELGDHDGATMVGTNALVATDSTGFQPVVGMHVASNGTSTEVEYYEPAGVGFFSAEATQLVITIALLEYDSCSVEEAHDAMVDLVPELPDRFGDDLPPVLGDCIQVEAPEPMQVGTPTDQVLELTLVDEFAGGSARLENESYFRYLELYTGGPGVLGDLPAGLNVEVVEHPVTSEPALRLFGMPIEAASGEHPLRFYGVRNLPDVMGEMPAAATVRLVVESFDLADPEPEPDPADGGDAGTLPASGADPGAGIALAGACVLLGSLVWRRAVRS